MPLTNEDLEQVLDYLKAHPESWMPAHVLDLAGRISTLEAELKAGREVMDKRFDEQNRHMNRWMTAMTLVLALVGVAVTVTNVMG
jgi:hypothetical protein